MTLEQKTWHQHIIFVYIKLKRFDLLCINEKPYLITVEETRNNENELNERNKEERKVKVV